MTEDPMQLFYRALNSTAPIFEPSRTPDVFRNHLLLQFFGDDDLIMNDAALTVYHERCGDTAYSLGFAAKWAGETLRWAIVHGLVERAVVNRSAAWRLLDRQMRWTKIGPEKARRQICIAGPSADPAAAKLVERERKRVARARAKDVALRRYCAEAALFQIGASHPEKLVTEKLAHLAVPGVTMILEMRNVLIDACGEDELML
ncbi:MAG: hypothetical protein ABI216_18665, partial [Devosia sp.]